MDNFGSDEGFLFYALIAVTDCGSPTNPGANGDVAYTDATF